jgi:hypothetical protein
MPQNLYLINLKKNETLENNISETETILISKKNTIPSLISYKKIISMVNLKKGLARTKNNVSPGLDGDTKANFTDKKNRGSFQVS